MQKLGKNPNFEVKYEIQRAKFGVFVTYIFGGKILGSNKNFRGKFWAKPPDLLIWKYPLGPPYNELLQCTVVSDVKCINFKSL